MRELGSPETLIRQKSGLRCMEINFLCDYGPSKGLTSELPEEKLILHLSFVLCLTNVLSLLPEQKNIRTPSLNERHDAK
jgi:hypothetical protein